MSFCPSVLHAQGTPLDSDLAGLESSAQRLISSICKTKRIAFFLPKRKEKKFWGDFSRFSEFLTIFDNFWNVLNVFSRFLLDLVKQIFWIFLFFYFIFNKVPLTLLLSRSLSMCMSSFNQLYRGEKKDTQETTEPLHVWG